MQEFTESNKLHEHRYPVRMSLAVLVIVGASFALFLIYFLTSAFETSHDYLALSGFVMFILFILLVTFILSARLFKSRRGLIIGSEGVRCEGALTFWDQIVSVRVASVRIRPMTKKEGFILTLIYFASLFLSSNTYVGGGATPIWQLKLTLSDGDSTKEVVYKINDYRIKNYSEVQRVVSYYFNKCKQVIS